MKGRISTPGPLTNGYLLSMMTKSALIFSIILASLASGQMAFGQDGGEVAPAEEQPGQTAQLTLDDLRTFTDIFNQARKNYVEEVDDKTLLDAAIRGMLLELDPHSKYLPAKEYKELNDVARGRYSGIGIDVQAREGKIVVNAIINDSPADEAGMNPDDVITSINGNPVKGRPIPEAMDELLGNPDTEVVLTVAPPGGEERELTITRRYIQVPTLSFQLLDENYGYFKMIQFHGESAVDLEQSLDSIKKDDIDLRVLVIDLRNNPGGILQQAVAVADGFLDEGVIVSTRGRNSTMQMEFTAQPGQWLPDIPLMLLVDHGTASASEVLAGALQDHGRALVVGERTYGKGSIQSVLPLRNGAGIKLTTARYYTPSGRSIQAEGIEPDVAIEWDKSAGTDSERQRESDLERHLGRETELEGAASPGMESAPEDFPLGDVLDALRNAGIITG
jgi:carboxyl-terminal processing protease